MTEYIPYIDYDRLDLMNIMTHEDRPQGRIVKGHTVGWGAGDQLKALKYYTGDHLQPLVVSMESDWQGEICSVWKLSGYPVYGYTKPVPKYLLIRDSFGSCSGCDALEGNQNGYEYVKDVLMENTIQFLTIENLRDYMLSSLGRQFFGHRTDDDYEEFLYLIGEYIANSYDFHARCMLCINDGVDII